MPPVAAKGRMRASRDSAGVAARSWSDGIPLDLLPLVAQFGRDRRVGLRVERLPDRARFSRGRNNGDRSWSLTRDELDGLYYIPPKGANEPHTLAVRIIGLDGGDGTTLAIHDVTVSPDDVAKSDIPAAAAMREEGHEDEIARMRSELTVARLSWEAELGKRLDEAAAKAAAKFEKDRTEALEDEKARRAELEARVRERVEDERARWQRETDAMLAKAESAWKLAERGRLSAAEATWREQSTRMLADMTARCERAEAALAERDTALTRSRVAGEQARKDAEREIAAALAKAEGEWKKAEAGRLVIAEARLREQSARALAEATVRSEKAEAALAQSQAEAEKARREWERDAKLALSRTEKSWREEEAQRLAAAEAKWREQSTRALGEAVARAEKAEAALAEARTRAETGREKSETATVKRLREELSSTRAALADREKTLAEREMTLAARDSALADREKALAERDRALGERDKALAQSHANVEAARRDSEQARGDALARAEAAWKVGEASRLASAKAQWREQTERALAELTARCERAETELAGAGKDGVSASSSREEGELARLRDELATAKVALTESETAILAARSLAQEAGERKAQELRMALAKAEKEWKVAEVARAAAAEAKWREQAALAIAGAEARAEKAEAALKAARASAAQPPEDRAEVQRLVQELSHLRKVVAERELELARMETALQQARELRVALTPGGLERPEQVWGDEEPEAQGQVRIRLRKDPPALRARELAGGGIEEEPASRRLILDVAFVALLAVATVVYYPRIAPMIAQRLPFPVPQALTGLAAAPSQPASPAPAAPPQKHALVNVSLANVRAAPKTGATIVVTLPRGSVVTPVETRGGWVHVRVGSTDGKPDQDGWIYGAYLKDIAGS